MSKNPDPIFVLCARKAPLEDARFYLRAIEKHLAVYELSDQTIGIARELLVLEREMADVFARLGNTASFKARVWAIVDRYKGSIPGWAGRVGVSGGVEAQPVPLRDLRDELGLTPLQHRPFRRLQLLAMRRADQQAERARVEQFHRFRVPLRTVPLTLDAARAILHADTPEAPAVTVKRQAKRAAAPAIACPACSAPLTVTGPADLRCPSCATSWHLAPKTAVTRRVAAANRPPSTVDWRAAGLKAAETRRLNAAKRAAEQVAA